MLKNTLRKTVEAKKAMESKARAKLQKEVSNSNNNDMTPQNLAADLLRYIDKNEAAANVATQWSGNFKNIYIDLYIERLAGGRIGYKVFPLNLNTSPENTTKKPNDYEYFGYPVFSGIIENCDRRTVEGAKNELEQVTELCRKFMCSKVVARGNKVICKFGDERVRLDRGYYNLLDTIDDEIRCRMPWG